MFTERGAICSRFYTEELFGDDPAAVGVLDTTVKLQPRKGMKKKDLGEIRVMLMYAPLWLPCAVRPGDWPGSCLPSPLGRLSQVEGSLA